MNIFVFDTLDALLYLWLANHTDTLDDLDTGSQIFAPSFSACPHVQISWNALGSNRSFRHWFSSCSKDARQFMIERAIFSLEMWRI